MKEDSTMKHNPSFVSPGEEVKIVLIPSLRRSHSSNKGKSLEAISPEVKNKRTAKVESPDANRN